MMAKVERLGVQRQPCTAVCLRHRGIGMHTRVHLANNFKNMLMP